MPSFNIRKAGVSSMRSLDMSGKTVDEAVEKALTELNVTKDKVEIKVIDEGSKGIFGIFKTKDAKVHVTIKEDYKEDAKKFLRDVLKDRKSTRLNSSHANISYAVFCLKKKKN